MAEEEMTTASGEPHPAAGVADMIDFAYAQDFNKATEEYINTIELKVIKGLSITDTERAFLGL
jgi:hypothetical protein